MPSDWLQDSEQSHTEFVWPMPRDEDIFSKQNSGKYSTTFDLYTRYHHITLDEDSLPKTAFTSPFWKYEYLKVPFGLAQAPVYFQELMNQVLKHLPLAIAYLDDIIIYSKTAQEHLDHLQQVFHNFEMQNYLWNWARATPSPSKFNIWAMSSAKLV